MVSIGIRLRGKVLVDAPGAVLVFHQEYRRAFAESIRTLRDMVRARTPVGATGRLYRSVSYSVQDLTRGGPQGSPSEPIEFKGSVFSSSGVPPTPWAWVTGAAVFLGPGALLAAPFLTKPEFMACTYAAPVEYGTKPHFPPVYGPESIHSWVTHVLPMMPKMEAALVAFKIAVNISHHGTRGRFMFRDARQAFMASGILEKNFAEAGRRASEQVKRALETEELPWWAQF